LGVPEDVSGGDSVGLFGRYAGYWGAGRGTRRRRGEEEDHHRCDRLGQRREGVKSEQGRQVADAARELRPDLKVLFITGHAENAVIGHGNLERVCR
jgi:hypothetical protein